MLNKFKFEKWFNCETNPVKKNFSDFCLTTQMIEKNDFSDEHHYVIVTNDTDGTSGIAIYDQLNNDAAYLNSIEVRKDCRNQGLGKQILNALKQRYNNVYIGSIMPNTDGFYDKMNFKQDNNGLKWSKNEKT